MSRHCPACAGRGIYGGEACPVCSPARPHDPDHPSGFTAIWAVLTALAVVVWLLTL